MQSRTRLSITRCSVAVWCFAFAAAGAIAAPAAVGPDPGAGFLRLPGHVASVLAEAAQEKEPARAGKQAMTLTFTLKRDDQAGFDRYLRDVYDPQSENYRNFLNQAQLTARFGPSRRGYAEVLAYLRDQGFKLIEGSRNRLTLTVRGTRAAAEQAFRLAIDDYKVGDSNVYANVWDPAVPRILAARLVAIDGLSSLSRPQPVEQNVRDNCRKRNFGLTDPKKIAKARKACIAAGLAQIALAKTTFCFLGGGPLVVGGAVVAGTGGNVFAGAGGVIGAALFCDMANLITAFNNVTTTQAAAPGAIAPNPAAQALQLRRQSNGARQPLAPPNGAGQTVGLLEFDGFRTSDVRDFLALYGAATTQIDNLSVVPVNGGVASPGSGESEVLLDIDTLMTLAPAAKVVVYEAPFNGQTTSYTTLFNAMINGGVTVISNSWASCEDQISAAQAQAIDVVLQAAAASGISVFNGSGDSGSTCLDGSANTISVPADSPNATAVGGTSLPLGFGPGATYGSETWWDGTNDEPSTGQSGFGLSKFFSRPAYQNSLNTAAMRSVPDVVIRADPANGVIICQADNGGCPSGTLNGGTSLAAPEWAAAAALLNQAQGKNLGAFNPLLYPLAVTDAFHNAGSMGSDFLHVGLGSPNLNVMNRLLKGQALGRPDAGLSQIAPLYQAATVITLADQTAAVPADGTSQGGVLVTLIDANGNSVSGKTVTLAANGGQAVIAPASAVSSISNGAVAFSITDLTAETVTFTATDTTDGIVLPPVKITFGVPPAASAGINVAPSAVAADGLTAATLTVTLKDALNRPTPGKRIRILDGNAHAVITGPAAGVTDANGQIQFSATDQVNESVTFTAVDVTDNNLPVPGSGTVNYSGGTNTACGVGTAPVAGAGYSITSYVTGLPAAPTLFYGNINFGCPGAINPTFPPNGTVLIADFVTGDIYKTGSSGGAVSSANVVINIGRTISNLVFGKDGSLYAVRAVSPANSAVGDIVQLNPVSGAIVRVVASGFTCPAGLAVDPLSGDLFFDNACTGAGQNASIFRVIDPANTDAARPTSVVVYATLPAAPNAGLAFAPDGTLYAVSGYFGNPNAPVQRVSATNSSTVRVSALSGVTSDFGIAIGRVNADGSAQSLIVEPAGALNDVPLANPSAFTTIASVSPGVGVGGPDGCLYSAKYDSVYRLAKNDGSCNFAPTSPAPSLKLSPATVVPNPPQGGSQTFTASLSNVNPRSAVAVFFEVVGANSQTKLASTDVNGNATFTYAAKFAGVDTISAVTPLNGVALVANPVQLTWTAGADLTSIYLNRSPQAGQINQAVTVVATLSDDSVDPTSPVAPLSGQTVQFALGGGTCSAITDGTGSASCQVTPTQSGSGTLTAVYAGTSRWVGSRKSVSFNVAAAPALPPVVTLSASPDTVAVGSSSTLSWSSTNATACAASGSWSGAQALSGTLKVTPNALGSFTYTLTCTGAGGAASAATAVSATLVPVTVTAKSGGGGTFAWQFSAILGVLVLLRLRVPRSCIACLLLVPAGMAARAADSGASPDHLYAGIRLGVMPLNLDMGNIERALAAAGYSQVLARQSRHDLGGTLYAGYEFNAKANVEFGYSHHESSTVTLNGVLPAGANIGPFLREVTKSLHGYGSIYSLSYRARFEVAPRFSLDPRGGAFYWESTAWANAADGSSASATHRGGGLTAGLGAAYRVGHRLELGLGVDYFRGTQNNIATLYAGTLEWHFGPR